MNYKIGLDIGVASVGSCVIDLDKQKIHSLGSRVFEKAEVPKTGESLATEKRNARSGRKTKRRRKYRVKKVKNLIVKSDLFDVTNVDDINKIYVNNILGNVNCYRDKEATLWDLRVFALDNIITSEQLQMLMLYFVKHRGFKSNRKSEAKEDESGKILESINENKTLLEEKNYRTTAEMMLKEEKFNVKNGHYISPLRNRGANNYVNSINRDMLVEEINIIFETQRKLGNKQTTEELQEEYLKIFNMQRPVATGDEVIKKLGKCSLETKEDRAAKACYTSEIFVALTKLINLRTSNNKKLNGNQIKEIIEKSKNTKKITLNHIRGIMNKAEETKLLDNERFNVKYEANKDNKLSPKEVIKKTENKEFFTLKQYHTIKFEISKHIDFETLDTDTLDTIGTILTFYKTDEDIRKQLELQLPTLDKEVVESLLYLSFAKPVNLSLKAMKKLIPHMMEGLRYDEARKIEYPNSFVNDRNNLKKYLPKIKYSDIRNPVVYRSLCQTRQVLNNIIARYGSPCKISIETARDLSKNFSERKEIEDKIKQNRTNNEKAIKKLKEQYGIDNPTGLDIQKMKLYEQQGEKCMYTGEKITIDELFTTMTEIDHIKPFSKTFDNSQNNKVLVLTKENQVKLDRLPLEYMEEEQKHNFIIQVEASNLPYRKKQNLLKEELTEADISGFKDNDLNNTRYISRFISNYIKENLKFNENYDTSKQFVYMPSGGVTDYLRTIYGFNKIRENGDTHHALDAAIVAICDQSVIQKINLFAKRKELYYKNPHTGNYVNKKTGEVLTAIEMQTLQDAFPEPWAGFVEELRIRMGDSPAYDLRNAKNNLIKEKYSDYELENLKPIFVSRAKFEKTTGKMHKDTIGRLEEKDGKNIRVDKVPLSKIDSVKKLDEMYDKERNIMLYNALKKRLEEKGKEAFNEPFYKPTKDGSQGPIVRSIKLQSTTESFFEFQEKNGKVAVADNGGMYRIDIFQNKKTKKYCAVPIYISDVYKGVLPNKACKAQTKRKDWPEMTSEYDFVMSVSKNDYLVIENKKATIEGYYVKFNSANAIVTLKKHDNSEKDTGVGISFAKKIEKFRVSMLGDLHLCEREERKSPWVTNK